MRLDEREIGKALRNRQPQVGSGQVEVELTDTHGASGTASGHSRSWLRVASLRASAVSSVAGRPRESAMRSPSSVSASADLPEARSTRANCQSTSLSRSRSSGLAFAADPSGFKSSRRRPSNGSAACGPCSSATATASRVSATASRPEIAASPLWAMASSSSNSRAARERVARVQPGQRGA